MRRSRIICLTLIFLQFLTLPYLYAESGPQYSLIVVELGKNAKGVAETQTLVRYHIRDGKVMARESILTTRTIDIRYDLGPNQIYANRYVITGSGDVVDLQTKQAIFKSKGEFVGIDHKSNSVIVRVDRGESQGLYAFELDTHSYESLGPKSRWAMPGKRSPNGELSATGDDGKIWVHWPNGKELLLGSDFWSSGTVECSSTAKPAFVWINDRQLLTQRGNGNLFILDITGHSTPLVTIPNVSVRGWSCGPKLERDLDGQIYFQDSDHAWRIDVPTHTTEPYPWQPIGNGFEIEHSELAPNGLFVRYHNEEIGRLWCNNAVTAPGHVAAKFGPAGSNLAYPEGVKVWSVDGNEWTTIKPEWLATIIGWVQDEA